mgnify:FL=1
MTQMKIRVDRNVTNGAEASRHFVLVEVKARRQEEATERVELDLGIALDRSGSMSGSKFQLACEGVATSLGMLHERDRFSLVTFNEGCDLIAAHAFATSSHKATALEQLRRAEADGGTDLFEGYVRATQQVGQDLREDCFARVLLLTDGQANRGVVDEDAIVARVEKLRLCGILTSTLGIGADFNETLLQRMAAAGGGNSYFIENARQLPDVLSGEVGDALEVTERNVVLEVRVPEHVRVAPMDDSRLTVVPEGLRIALGDLVSEQLVRVVLEVVLPHPSVLAAPTLDFVLESANEYPIEDRVTFRVGDPMLSRGTSRDHEVMKVVYPAFAARARQAAADLNAKGDFAGSRASLEEACQQLYELAEGDSAAREILDALRHDSDLHGQRMTAFELKRRRFEAMHALRDRDPDGRPRRDA